MPVLTFPLATATFADALKYATVSFRLRRNEEYSGLGSGQILGAQLGPDMWEADVTLARLYHAQAMQVQALIESLDGVINDFYLYNPLTAYPQYDPTGSKLGASVPRLMGVPSGKTIAMDGVPSGYTLTRGDMLSFDYGSGPVKRALHRVVETRVANSSGVLAAFEVRPHIRTGAADNAIVTLIKPSAKMIMVPDTFAIENDTLVTSVIRFKAIQKP